jgi:outer membrane beta-barrel protein
MEIRIQRVFLVALVFSLSGIYSNQSAADEVNNRVFSAENHFFANGQADGSLPTNVKVQVERREVLEDILDAEDFEFGVQTGLISIEDFESNLWLSGYFSYHISEYFYAKAQYGYAKAGETSFEKLANVPPLLTDAERKLTYYGLNIGYNLMPGEIFLTKNLAFNSLFSIEIGGGSTKFAGNSKFTVNFTANYRVFLTDWITWDIGMSDYIFDSAITGKNKTTHNLNLVTGVSFYF